MNGPKNSRRRNEQGASVRRYVVYLPVLLSMFVMLAGITQCNNVLCDVVDENGDPVLGEDGMPLREKCVDCTFTVTESNAQPCKTKNWRQPDGSRCDAALSPDLPDGEPCDSDGDGQDDGMCMSGVCEAGQTTLVLEQASKQVGSALVCSDVLLPGEDYSFELSPLVVESDGNNNVSLSGQLRVTGSCSAFLVPPVRLDTAEISVSVAGATPVTLTGVVEGLPAEVPDIGSTCDGLFDITVAVPTELTVSETVVDFTPTDIVASISKSGFGSADVSKSNSGCDFVPDAQLPSVVSFSAQPADPCFGNPCDDGNSCTVDTCTVDSASNTAICDNSAFEPDGTSCDDLLPNAGTCVQGACYTTPAPVTKEIDVLWISTTTDNSPAVVSYELSATALAPVVDGVPVDFAIDGVAVIPVTWLKAVNSAVGGLGDPNLRLELTALSATVVVRSGAMGSELVLAPEAALPATLQLPLETDETACCTAGDGGTSCWSYWDFGYCILEDVRVPLQGQTLTLIPNDGVGGTLLIGWDETPVPSPSLAPGPISSQLQVVSNFGGGFGDRLELTMGTIEFVDGIATPRSLTDAELISIPISP
jgi:hypothetical protein